MSNDRQDHGNEPESIVDKEASDQGQPVQDQGLHELRIQPEEKDQKGNENESRAPLGDICRICHMGGFPGARGAPEPPSAETDSDISSLSSYAFLGPLISACKCRGTVGLVHAECLERWLTESGHTRCELCGYKYATKRVPRHNILRSLAIWFNTAVVTRQMILDVLYLIVTTPLAFFSCYVCVLAITMLANNGFQQVPWMLLAMLPTCFLTLVAYWGWVITLGRLHGRRWRRYWRNNFVIRLLPNNAADLNDLILNGSARFQEEEELEQELELEEEDDEIWRDIEIEELIEAL